MNFIFGVQIYFIFNQKSSTSWILISDVFYELIAIGHVTLL